LLDGNESDSGNTLQLNVNWDTDGNDALSSSATGSTDVTVGGANGMQVYFCCK
jgi:hypothetical protein